MNLTAAQLKTFLLRLDELSLEQRDRILQALFCTAWPTKLSQNN